MSRLTKIKEKINKTVSKEIECREWHSAIVLEGMVTSWAKVVTAGKLAARKGYKGVVNRIEVQGLNIKKIKKPEFADKVLDKKKVDVLIIGGGIIGCAIARELSKWDISLVLVEKEEDLAMHASARNDGMIHPGLVPEPKSKKAYFNVRGNKLYSRVTEELNVKFKRPGSYILFDKWQMKLLYPLIKLRAKQNGVEGIRLLAQDELRKREPAVCKDIKGALYIPSTGVLSPYKMTVAYAENAVANGAEVFLNTVVLAINKEGNRIVSVKTNRGLIYPRIVINAAGVYSDKIAEMAGDQFFTIHPRKGEIVLLDKKKGGLLEAIFAKPSLNLLKGDTKGGGIVKTIDGNVLIGPDAYEYPYREDYSTNRENIDALLQRHLPLFPEFSKADVITYFAGIRAATYEEDFIVEKSEYVQNLIYAAGIQSPGLASAPAIAEEIEKITVNTLKKIKKVIPKKGWNPRRKGIPDLSHMSYKERKKLIKENPAYGRIVCRCEEISEGEIIDAIHSPIPVLSVDAIKRRVRAGMGRCQGGFCMPQVARIMEKETGIRMLSITKKGDSSYILVEETKKIGGERG